MVKERLLAGAALLGVALVLTGCAVQKAEGPSQEQSVLAAQYASKRPGSAPAMQSAEADAIYQDYIANIGKPLETQDSQTGVQSR